MSRPEPSILYSAGDAYTTLRASAGTDVFTSISVVPSPWWALRQDSAGQYVEMGQRLPCGHDVKARSRQSNAQLRRNFHGVVARHRCDS